MKKLKKVDFTLIDKLVGNSTYKIKKLAEECSVSEKTIRNRLDALESSGVIKKQVVVNPAMFGYNIKFDVFIKLDGKMDQIFKLLNEKYYFNILYIGTHWGDDDLSAQLVFKDAMDVTEFKDDCNNLKTVKSINMTMVPIVFKDTYDWIPNPLDFDKNYDESRLDDIKNKIKR